MAHISPKNLQDFKNTYKTTFGSELSDNEALEKCSQMITFFKNILPSNAKICKKI